MKQTLITTSNDWKIYANNNTGVYTIKKGSKFWDFTGSSDHNKNMEIIKKILEEGGRHA